MSLPKQSRRSRAHRLFGPLAAGLTLIGLLLGCGGVGQDGTGAAPESQSTGVINGFGSGVLRFLCF